MSIDLEGFKDGVPWARDLKFGLYHDPWQLRVHAMALAAKHKTFEIDVGFAFIDPGTGEHRIDAEVLYLPDLDAWGEELASAWDTLEGLEAELRSGSSLSTNEGPWCSYCGALPHCPSKMRLAHALAELDVAGASLKALTPAQRGDVWVKYQQYKKALESIGDSLKELAEIEPIPLPTGKLLRMVKVRGYSYPEKHATLTLLKDLGATREQIQAVMKHKDDYMQPKETNK
jgi:Protein of unknown function (DUF2800)